MGRTSDAKERIVESAIELIHARSAGGVGVQEICKHAGVKKGSFYHFFDSKQELVLATLDQQWRITKRDFWEPAFAKDISPLKRIEKYMELVYQYTRDMKANTGRVNGCGFGNMAAEISTQDEAIRHKVEQVFMEAVATIKSALDDAVATGDLPELDTMEGAKALWAYLEGAFLLAKCKQNPEVLKDLSQTAMQLLETLGRQAPLQA